MEALKDKFELPRVFYPFHSNRFINFQLNRWYSLGYTRRDDIAQVAQQIRNFEDYIDGFTDLAETAKQENRLKNAAFYYRAAELLVEPEDERKIPLYNDFINTFYQAFPEDSLQRHKVPYKGGCWLPALYIPAKQSEVKGTILGFGGFDSFIEEFYCIWNYFSHTGFNVIAFEGPGQGGALRNCGLTFEHDWEKPCAAVLDHFKVDKAACLGISMGGYWAIRAAAFEKRIQKVIAFPPVYDWLEMTHPLNKKLVQQLMRWPNFLSLLISIKMLNGTIRHAMNQAMNLVQSHEPVDAARWFLHMNKEHIHSKKVDQDVLLLAGEADLFQPPVLMEKQKAALVNARSVTTRIFTAEEKGEHHCQIGNIGLALDTISQWLLSPH